VTLAEVLADGFSRIRQTVHEVVGGLDPDQLAYRPDPHANSIAWLIWHLARIQDDHVAHVAGTDQVWMSRGWAERLALPFEPAATGWGQSADEVGAVRVRSGDLLTGYYDAVHDETLRFVRGLVEADLDRVVDRSWDPPVTLGVRLVSVLDDNLQHSGQAAYVRGLLERR
jgi:uncharacterized damage-inducible protein DinB